MLKFHMTLFIVVVVTSTLMTIKGTKVIDNDDVKRVHTDWMGKHGITYSTADEERLRFGVFMDNLQFILAHNIRHSLGEVSFSMSMNQHMDRTFEEFRTSKLTYVPSSHSLLESSTANGYGGQHHSPLIRGSIPDTVDWRSKGAVTDVKDQGQCGSCWSFSTTGAIEGAHYLATGELVSLSEEQLINCVKDGAFDCKSGGDMGIAFQYVIDNGGLVAEKEWPYALKDHQKCKYKRGYSSYSATIRSFKTIPMNDEVALKSAVALTPVAIAIDASQRSFQFYHSGVYDEPECCHNCKVEDLDHGVLAVGYGSEDGKDYWLVKNSWAASWGENGYIKIVRNKKGACGVATQALYPIV